MNAVKFAVLWFVVWFVIFFGGLLALRAVGVLDTQTTITVPACAR